VKPEKLKEFIAVTTANHIESVKEAGNLRFDLLQQSDDPSRFMLYEAFISEKAAAFHKTTAHYLYWREAVNDFMAEPRRGVRYDIVEPQDPAKW